MRSPMRVLAAACVVALIGTSIGRSATSIVGQSPELEAIQSESADIAHGLAVLQALRDERAYVPGEVLVRFREGVGLTEGASALRVLRATIGPQNARWIGTTLHLRDLEVDPVRAAESLSRQPEVLYAQPNYVTRLRSVPNDTGWSQQWNLPLINMPQAWDINTSAGGGVVVAVVDSGLTTTDGNFSFRIWTGTNFQTFAVPIARTADFDHARVDTGVDLQPFGGWSSGGRPVIFDAGGHGTHVAGTIAQQTNNGTGYAGIANGVRLMPIKACFEYWDAQLWLSHVANVPGFAPDTGGCSTSAIVAGIRYAADNGANVINVSIGGPIAQPAERDAINYAVSRGAFVAVAGGNEALDGNSPSYPGFHASEINGAMAVAAVTPSRQRAPYSTSGSYIEIAAPGGAGSDGSPADQIWQIGPNQSDLAFLRLSPAFNRYQNLSNAGTSMAAPHVAALAALLYSQGVTKPSAIEAAIKRFARDIGSPGRDDEFGHGLIDARATLRGLGLTR